MKKEHLIVVSILLLAAFLRFWQLGQNPPSLTWDEAAWGYNAYSLGIDGRDEFGNFLPLTYLESFGDFKPPVYAYLDILPIKIFGLSEFAVRFPSAFFGVLTVLITYLLTKELFLKRFTSEVLAILTALLLAISPWHINLSRAAFEANVATFFLVLGVWLFLLATKGVTSFPPLRWNSIDTSGVYLVFSVISFVLSMYTFNTARIVAPLLVIVLFLGFYKKLLRIKKQTIIAIVAGIILFLPLAQFLLTPQAKLRFQEVNIFSDPAIIKKVNQEIANDNVALWSKILHNRRFAYTVEYFKHYFDNFNPGFLFIKGDGNPKFSTQDVGQMYLWDLPFFVAGIIFLLKKRVGFWWIIPVWLLIGIIPAGTARETPHALRIETTLPMFQILIAYGLVNAISNLKSQISNIKLQHLLFTTCYLLLIFNFIYYHHGYYAHYPREFSGEWQYGYREAINYLKTVDKNYDKVYFTESLGRPYIYMLFYTQYNPQKFKEEAVVEREVFGFVHVKSFGKYYFVKSVTAFRNETEGKTLFIDVSDKVPGDAQVLKTFTLLNQKPVLTAYTF